MAIGEADVFEIIVLASSADAFLATGSAFVIALFEAEKNVLELVHASVGEEQRGVVRGDERGTAHDAVAALLEEAEEGRSDFVAGQLVLGSDGRGAPESAAGDGWAKSTLSRECRLDMVAALCFL